MEVGKNLSVFYLGGRKICCVCKEKNMAIQFLCDVVEERAILLKAILLISLCSELEFV